MAEANLLPALQHLTLRPFLPTCSMAAQGTSMPQRALSTQPCAGAELLPTPHPQVKPKRKISVSSKVV